MKPLVLRKRLFCLDRVPDGIATRLAFNSAVLALSTFASRFNRADQNQTWMQFHTGLLRDKPRLAVGLLLGLYVASLLVNLGVLEFSGEEPRRAMIAVEMLDSGNYTKPTQYGWNYYNKPPLFNWVLCVVIWLTGSTSEAVLRLPSVFFYLLMAAVHYKVTKRFFPKGIALLSAFFVLTCMDLYTYGLAYGGEIDIFYSFLVYTQAISLFWFYQKRRYLNLYVVSYSFCALGFLTKAFPSLVFQGLTLAALCVYAKSVRIIFKWQHAVGLAVFFFITGLYFFLYNQQVPAVRFLINLLNEAMLKSGVGDKSNKLLDKTILYPWLFFKLLLPWSLLLGLLFVRSVRHGFRSNPAVWFSVLFIAFNLWVYWFTGQPKMRYVYMFIPFACTVLAHLYQRFAATKPAVLDKGFGYTGYLFASIAIGITALPFFVSVSARWAAVLAVGLGAVVFALFKNRIHRVWLFITGLVTTRLIYAALLVPLQRQGIDSYDEAVRTANTNNELLPLQYWADAVPFAVAIQNKALVHRHEVIQMPQTLPLEIPYYYYRQTGRILRFDTLPQKPAYYVAYEGQLKAKAIDTVYAYFDKNLSQRVVFYRLRE